MFSNDGYALLIGVDDYSAFDASCSQAPGTSDLRGSRNDVRVFWRLCRLIGIKPSHIRVLASPAIPFAELEGATADNVGLATEAEILSGAAWLASKLGHASKPTGIVTYSGHGDWVAGQGLVLCPGDVTAAPDANGDVGLAHAVSFAALNAHLAQHAENLTVVLDTCHSGPSASLRLPTGAHLHGRPLTLTQRPLSALPGLQHTGRLPELEELAGRVLSAARRDQVAFQSKFDGHYRGVFSWAVSAALEQWRVTEEDGNNVRYHVSYGKLVETTQRLIAGLWLDQIPQLHGPAGVGDLAVLRRGLVGQPGETTSLPDGGFQTEEIDPGSRDYVIYTLTDNSGTQYGKVLVTNTAGYSYSANTEYWYIVNNLSNGSAVTFSGGIAGTWSRPPGGLGTLSFKTARTPTWTSGSSSGSMLAYSNALTGEYDGMNWQMSNASGSWSGSITWWHNSTGNLFGPGVVRTLSPTSTSYTGYYYVSYPI